MEDLSGLTIKGYKLQERIGAGGFGAVYRAYQSTVGREVAVKIILPGFTNHPDFIRRFESEAQLIARLEHLHIAPLHDYWRDPEGAYLVMRYLRGGSLRDALRQGAYDLEGASVLLDQVAAALSHAHRNNVIHRDIKPENILLDEDGNAYVADFGIAKDIGLDGDERTAAGSFVGSPDYLAPEQARGEAVTARTDIYSLGVVLYEMVVGQHPFPGLTPVERLFKHVNDPLPETTELDDDVREGVDRIIQKATAKDPKRRYADVRRMADDFREAAGLGISHVARRVIELLTPREQEVLKLVVDGKSNPEIADALTIELTTVKWYVNQIYRKLKVRSRVQAIVRAREMDLIVETDDFADLSTSFLQEPENPYKGLESFRSSDEHHFFGREKLTKQLLSKMAEDTERSRFLAVVGPSGSGKSSLVKAGLIPAIWRGGIPGSERWFIIDMLPGARPLDELEIALQRIAGPQSGNLMEHLRRDEHGLVRATNLVLPDDDSELLLLIDQFEELFTQVESEDERTHFLGLLQAAVDGSRSRVRVVLTLRADFYDRPLQYPGFGELVQERTLTVLPLSAEELERAILHPAERVGVQFEEGLVASIIEDVHYQPGGLPLMQYALTELFDGREDHTLTHEAYYRIGGAVGALANRVDGIFAELDEPGQQAVRQVFLRLVTLGEGAEDTRRRFPRSELLAIGEDPFLVDELIDTYADHRLLSLDHDPETRSPTVELAHEAILREWDRLRGWLDESRADIRLERELARAARDWRAAGEDSSYLLRGMRLAQYEEWSGQTDLALSDTERAFVQASLKVQQQERTEETARQVREAQLETRRHRLSRALIGVLGAGLALALGLSAFAFSQRQSALRQASAGLAAQALAELDGRSPERGVLLALEALENYPYTPQAEAALANAVLHMAMPFSIGVDEAFANVRGKWSPQGDYLAIGSFRILRVWDVRESSPEIAFEFPELFGGVGCQVKDLDWSPSGESLVLLIGTTGAVELCPARGVRVLAVSSNMPVLDLGGADLEARSVDWSPDGEAILTGSSDGVTRVWDSDSRELSLELEGHTDDVSEAAWSPSGNLILTVSWDGTARVWERQSGRIILETPDSGASIVAGSWSPSEDRFATASQDGLARIWDLNGAGSPIKLIGHNAALTDVAWSPDGQVVATASLDGTVRVWNPGTGGQLFVFRHPGGTAETIFWSPDSAQLAAPGTSLVYGWHLPSRRSLELVGHTTSFMLNVDWSPDGSKIASTSDDLTARIWDASTGAELMKVSPAGGEYVAWSPDGAQMVTAGYVTLGAEIWNTATGERVIDWPRSEPTMYVDGHWSPDGSLIAVDRFPDYGVDVLEVTSGDVISTFSSGGACMDSYPSWSPDGSRIVTGCVFTETEGDNTPARIWDPLSGDLLATLEGTDGESWIAKWSPDGSLLAVGYDSGVVKVWDASDRAVVSSYGGHSGIVWDVDWSPSGNRIASGDEAGNVRVWNALTGGEVMALDLPHWVSTVRWSPSGDRLAIGGGTDTPTIWPAWETTEQLIDYAYACCVFRELTSAERAQFGLPAKDFDRGQGE